MQLTTFAKGQSLKIVEYLQSLKDENQAVYEDLKTERERKRKRDRELRKAREEVAHTNSNTFTAQVRAAVENEGALELAEREQAVRSVETQIAKLEKRQEEIKKLLQPAHKLAKKLWESLDYRHRAEAKLRTELNEAGRFQLGGTT